MGQILRYTARQLVSHHLTTDTPPDRLERLSAAARAAMSRPEMARALEAMAFVPVTDSTPERATRFIADEAALWRPVIRATNIEID